MDVTEYNKGENWIKADLVRLGLSKVKIINSGEIRESQFKDSNKVTKRLVIQVIGKDNTVYSFSLSKKTSQNFTEKWGAKTEAWVGNYARLVEEPTTTGKPTVTGYPAEGW